ncbi:MAG: ABC transporter permease [Chloroflexi bacterium]|nr:ABC transporter permease [Chloroflexota bacterium]
MLIHEAHTEQAGIIWSTQNTPETEDDKPDTAYLRVGGSAILFFPYQLERTIVRAIPFIIAGLAVALGFKAGLFNIGAEGQLYLGGLLAVFVGYSPLFDFLPGFTRVIVVLVAGILGGALWGAIPGLLKAYTGAHEVINTIMMNYIALRLTDWLINSSDPYIMRDPSATNPATPNVHPNAILPRLDDIASWWFVVVAVVFFALQIYRHREAIQRNLLLVIRPRCARC